MSQQQEPREAAEPAAPAGVDEPGGALAELEAKLRAPDAIMEPGVLDVLKDYLLAGGKRESAIEDLSENYAGYAQMGNVMCEWLEIADVRVGAQGSRPASAGGTAAGAFGASPVAAAAAALGGSAGAAAAAAGGAGAGVVPDEFTLLQELARERFDPLMYLGVFRRGAPEWLAQLIAHARGRQLVYELSASHRSSLLLNYAIQRILKQGHEDEVARVGGSLASYFEVYHHLLATRLAAAAQATSAAALAKLAAEVAESCVGSQHTYVHAQQLLGAAAGWPGGRLFRRLAQEVEAVAAARHGGAAAYQLQPLFVRLSAGPQERRAAQLVSELLVASAPSGLPGGGAGAAGPADAGTSAAAAGGAAAAQLAAAAAQLAQLQELYAQQPDVPVEPLRHPTFMHLLLSGVFASPGGHRPGAGAPDAAAQLGPVETAVQLLALAVSGRSEQGHEAEGLGLGAAARDVSPPAQGASSEAVAQQLRQALQLSQRLGVAKLTPAELEVASEVCKQPVAAMGLLQHSQAQLDDANLYAEERSAFVLPNHLSLLHRVACEQPSLIPAVLALLRTVLSALGHNKHELSRSVLAFLASLALSGAAEPAMETAAAWSAGADPSLVRHFVLLLLESVQAPYSPQFARAVLGLMQRGLIMRVRSTHGRLLREFAKAVEGVPFLPELSQADYDLLQDLGHMD